MVCCSGCLPDRGGTLCRVFHGPHRRSTRRRVSDYLPSRPCLMDVDVHLRRHGILGRSRTDLQQSTIGHDGVSLGAYGCHIYVSFPVDRGIVGQTAFYPLAGKLMPWFAAAAVCLTVAGLYVGFFMAPTDAQQGEGYRIIFLHVPVSWMSMFIYVVMAFWAAVGLIFNSRLSAMMASALAPTGAMFTFLSLWTGALWGKPMWGTWWVWDARLTSELILLFLYMGFMALQSAIDDQRRADKAGAVLALVGVVNIPVIYFSVQWWNTLHQGASALVALGIALAAWIATAVVMGIFKRMRATRSGLLAQPRSWMGMHIAHLGMAVFVVGVTLVMGYETEQDIRMAPGQTVTAAGYELTFRGVRSELGANYAAQVGDIVLSRDGRQLRLMHPEKRNYFSSEMPMTEVAIDANGLRHLYVALGEPLADGAWSVRVHYKPFIDWIWIGCILMALGGLLAISDRRYRLKRRERRTAVIAQGAKA